MTKSLSFLTNKLCTLGVIFKVRDDRDELWKTVRLNLNSFQKLWFQSFLIFFNFAHTCVLFCCSFILVVVNYVFFTDKGCWALLLTEQEIRICFSRSLLKWLKAWVNGKYDWLAISLARISRTGWTFPRREILRCSCAFKPELCHKI